MTEPSRPYDLSSPENEYAPWDGPPLRTILICTQPRSGSTLLGEAIYFAGGLGCPLEYYHAGFRPRFAASWNAHSLEDFRDALWRRRTDPGGALAVKLMWRDVQDLALETDPGGLGEILQLPPGEVTSETYRKAAELLEDLFPNSISIHLYRRDRVRQAVSACIAQRTGQWRSIPGSEMPRLAEPDYDAEFIGRQIAYADYCFGHWTNLLAQMPGDRLALSYEDLTRDYAATVAGLLRALGNTAKVPPIRMRKQADTLSEGFVRRYLIENGVPVR